MSVRVGVDAAMAGTRVCRWLPVGNSFNEGEGASTFANTWRQRFNAKMRTGFGLPGTGLGSIPFGRYYTYLAASASWRTPMGGNVSTVPNWNITQGLKGIRFTGAGQYRETIVTGTAIDVVYLQASGTTNLQLSVDGSVVATITTNIDDYQPAKHFRHVFAVPGQHTVRVTSVGNANIIDNLVVYNGDHVSGIISYDCTKTGADHNDVTIDDIANGWEQILPDFIVDDQIGANDYLQGTNTPTTVANGFEVRMDKYITLASNPTVFILVPWNVPGLAPTNGLGFTYNQYVQACLDKLALPKYANFDYVIVDLRALHPDAASQPWHDADGTHSNNAGHEVIATDVYDAVFNHWEATGSPEEPYGGPPNRETFDWLAGLGYTGTIQDMQSKYLNDQYEGAGNYTVADLQVLLGKKPREVLRKSEWV